VCCGRARKTQVPEAQATTQPARQVLSKYAWLEISEPRVATRLRFACPWLGRGVDYQRPRVQQCALAVRGRAWKRRFIQMVIALCVRANLIVLREAGTDTEPILPTVLQQPFLGMLPDVYQLTALSLRDTSYGLLRTTLENESLLHLAFRQTALNQLQRAPAVHARCVPKHAQHTPRIDR
jgi:hypothetical protein